MKTTGSGHYHPNLARRLPIVTYHAEELRLRACLLNCLTTHYADLWRLCFDPSWRRDTWARQDPRLPAGHHAALTDTWTWATPPSAPTTPAASSWSRSTSWSRWPSA